MKRLYSCGLIALHLSLMGQIDNESYYPQSPTEPVFIAMKLLQQAIDDAVQRIDEHEVDIASLREELASMQINLDELRKNIDQYQQCLEYKIKYLIAAYMHDHAVQTHDEKAQTVVVPNSIFGYIASFFKPGKKTRIIIE